MLFRGAVPVGDGGVEIVDARFQCAGDRPFLVREGAAHHEATGGAAPEAQQREGHGVRTEGTCLDVHGLLLLSFRCSTAERGDERRWGGMRVVILGGGVIGTSIAYQLAVRGADPVVLESRSVACAASGK